MQGSQQHCTRGKFLSRRRSSSQHCQSSSPIVDNVLLNGCSAEVQVNSFDGRRGRLFEVSKEHCMEELAARGKKDTRCGNAGATSIDPLEIDIVVRIFWVSVRS
jgi:hypothetical protein